MEHDKDLEYSENFLNELDNFYPESSEVNFENPPFPPLDVLLLFADLSYLNSEELVKQVLPDDWRLLTTAYNTKSGYYGVAFWNPDMQLVSVAHRGTNSLKGVSVDIKGIALNKYTKYMASAITFVNEIISHLNDANNDLNICFRLSLTGHSLGGYLAQVTAFTARYNIRLIGDSNIYDSKGMLAHTRVFDSPGCKEMLMKLKDDNGKRYDGSMSLDKLDIEGYFIAANLVNTRNLHVGRLFMIDRDRVSGFIWNWFTSSVFSNISMHSLDHFKKALIEPNVVIKQVLDWPSGLNEKRKLTFQETKYNSFDPKCSDVHLYTNTFFDDHRSFSIFSDRELRFLDVWRCYIKSNFKITKIKDLDFDVLSKVSYEINEARRVVQCFNETDMEKLVRQIKKLFRWLPHKVKIILNEIELQSPILLFQSFDRIYRRQLQRLYCDFKDTLGLANFLSEGCKLFYIETDCAKFESSRIINIISQIKNQKYILNNLTFLSWENFLDLQEDFRIHHLHNSEEFTCDSLLVIDCSSFKKNQTKMFAKFLLHLQDDVEKKVIFIFPKESKYFKMLTKGINVKFKSCGNFVLNDLTEESRADVCLRIRVVLGDHTYKFNDFLGLSKYMVDTKENMNTILNRILPELVKESNEYLIILNNLIPSLETNAHYLPVEEDVTKERVEAIVGRGDVMLFLSGEAISLGGSNLRYAGEDAERDFRQVCHDFSTKTVFWIEYQNQEIEKFTVKYIYNNALYLKRCLHTQMIINIKNLIKNKHLDIFVFQGINDLQSLSTSLSLTGREVELFKENLIFYFSPKAEESNRNVHYLTVDGSNLVWKRSRGSLNGLRPYVTVDISHSVKETNLLSDHKQVVIIADEPGMGKSTTITGLESTLVDDKSSWIFRINLKCAEEQIKRLTNSLNITSLIEFLIPNKDNNVEQNLLKLCLESSAAKNIVLLFDGYDEIREDPSSKIKATDKILSLCNYIKHHTTARMIISTRKYKQKCLEDQLSEFATIFENVTKKHQQDYLEVFWHCHMMLKREEPDKGWLEKCSQILYRNAECVLGQDIKSLMGIPLQLKMLAEVFLPQIQEPNSTLEDNLKIGSVSDLYRQFVVNRFTIYEKTKSKAETGLPKSNYNSLMMIHRKLACQTLDPEFTKIIFTSYSKDDENWDEVNEMNRLGIIQTTSNDYYDFIHRTFAEFFFADLLLQWLQQKDCYKHFPIVDIFLEKFLLQSNFKIVRIFLENLLKSLYLVFKTNQLVLGDRKRFRDNKCRTALHATVNERNINILNLILNNLDLSQSPTPSYIATRDITGRTALCLALETDNPDIIEPFISTINKCKYESQLEILMATIFGYIKPKEYDRSELCLTVITKNDFFENKYLLKINESVLDRITNLLKEVDNCITYIEGGHEESVLQIFSNLKNDIERHYFPFGINSEGNSLINIAIEGRHMRLIETMLNEDIVNSKSKMGRTPLLCAVTLLNDSTLYHIVLINDEVFKMVKLLIKLNVDKSDLTKALNRPIVVGVLEVVKLLVQAGADIYSKEELGGTPLSFAAHKGHLPMVKYLMQQGGSTLPFYWSEALVQAAGQNHLHVVKDLVLNNIVNINARNAEGLTALLYAVHKGSLKIITWLCKNDVDTNLPCHSGHRPLHYAIGGRCLEAIRVLIKHGADINSPNGLGKTPLNLAVNLINGDNRLSNHEVSTKEIYQTVKILLMCNADVTLIHTFDSKLEILKAVIQLENLDAEDRSEYIANHLSKLEIMTKENTCIALMFAVHLGQENTVKLFEKFIYRDKSFISDLLALAANKYCESILKFLVKCYLIQIECEARIAMISRVHGELGYEIVDYPISNNNNINRENFNIFFSYSNMEDRTLRDIIIYEVDCKDESLPEIILTLKDETDLNRAMEISQGEQYKGLRELVLLYLRHECPLDSALVYAAKWEEWLWLTHFIDNGAKVNTTDVDGRTALHWAAHAGNSNIHILLHHGADPLMKDSAGHTPGDLAQARGHHEIYDKLTLNISKNIHKKIVA